MSAEIGDATLDGAGAGGKIPAASAGANAIGGSDEPALGGGLGGIGGAMGGVGVSGGGADGGLAGASGAGGDGGSAGEPPAIVPVPPSSLEQLVLWLDATSETCALDIDETVTHWTDKSPYLNDATNQGTNPRPKYVPAAANGHAALRFVPVPVPDSPDAATALTVVDSVSLNFGVGDFAYLLVMRWSNNPSPATGYRGAGAIIGKQAIQQGFPGVLLMANYPAFFSNVAASTRFAAQLELGGAFAVSYTDGFADDTFRLYVARRVGTDFSLRVNGSREGGTHILPSLDLGAGGAPLQIGGSIGMPFQGDIAEMIALHGVTSEADLTGVEAWLMNKYGLP